MFSSLGDFTQAEAEELEQRVQELEGLCSLAYFCLIGIHVKHPEVSIPVDLLDQLDNAASGLDLDDED